MVKCNAANASVVPAVEGVVVTNGVKMPGSFGYSDLPNDETRKYGGDESSWSRLLETLQLKE
jgi:hypothetical protein